MKPRIALAMIVKGTSDEAPMLDKCLKSVEKHIDGIFLNINNVKGQQPAKEILAVAKKYKANTIKTEWTGNFVKARTKNFAQIPDDYDWILWLDADDTVENPEKIPEVCAIVSPGVDGIYIKYNYAQDEYGNVIVEHYNARVVRNNGTFAWKSSFEDGEVTVHETLNEIRRVGKVMNNEWTVIHHSDPERMDRSLARNIKLLEGMLAKTKDSPDARILYYLATHYVDAGLLARAKELLEQYLKMSGWAEERSQAWVYLGDIYKHIGDLNTARGCYMKALAENPKDASPYVELGELEMDDQLWDKAIEYLEMATNKKPDTTATISKPMEATYRAYKALATCYTNLGVKGYKNASKYLKKAIKLRPYDPELQNARKMLDELQEHAELNESVLKIVNSLKQANQQKKILGLIDYLPDVLQDSPLVHSIRNYYVEPRKWPKKSIAIVCGGSAVGTWGPWSLDTGVGGSEEAVIQLSKILAKMGWKVEVYAIPGERAGEYDGVKWRHYWEFSSRDKFDVIIGWRDPALFDKKLNARKAYLWLHDVVDREELTKERLANLDKIIFVGQYHRDIYPEVPEKKCLVSGNGIDPNQFIYDNKFKRDLHRCVYMSAHERGLELLYKIWPDVRKAVPDATLDVYYGWKSFDEVNKDNPERMAWKKKLLTMEAELESQGVTNHGKIGHTQIVKEIYKSGVWAYPSPFPEVYCITGVKAQAGGAWPVISDYAALKDTVQYGDKQPMPNYDKHSRAGKWEYKDLEEYRDKLIHRLKNPPTKEDRTEMMKWARNNMSWEATAKEWSDEFSN